jgi:hypothetical protein
MAIKKQYALYDATATVFLNPLVFANDAEAIRWFTTSVNEKDVNKQSMVTLHPSDYTLYRLADYDDLLGMFQPRDVNTSGEPSQEPKRIINGRDVVDNEVKLTLEDIKELIQNISMPQNVTKMSS